MGGFADSFPDCVPTTMRDLEQGVSAIAANLTLQKEILIRTQPGLSRDNSNEIRGHLHIIESSQSGLA